MMKKSAKFIAIVLAVVLALSCFTVAFAANGFSVFDGIRNFLDNLPGVQQLKQDLGVVKEAAEAIADSHYDNFVEKNIGDDGSLKVPQIIPETIVPNVIKDMAGYKFVKNIEKLALKKAGGLVTDVGKRLGFIPVSSTDLIQ